MIYSDMERNVAEKIWEQYRASGLAIMRFRCSGLMIVRRIIGLGEPTCSQELVTALAPCCIVRNFATITKYPRRVDRENHFPPPVAPIIFQFRFVDNFLIVHPHLPLSTLTMRLTQEKIFARWNCGFFVELISACVWT